MKQLLVIFFCYFIFSGSGNKIKNDLEKNNLKGKVKMITEHCYFGKEINSKISKTKLNYWCIFKYDSMGNEVLKSEYAAEGYYKGDTINTTHNYIYNYNGDITEMYDDARDKNHFAYKDIYKYDSSGKIIEKDGYSDNLSLLYKELLKYDRKGNMIEEDDYIDDAGKNLKSKLFNYYDDYGNITRDIYYYPVDSILWENKCNYDKGGNEIECHHYEKSNLAFIDSSGYDVNGNKSEYYAFDDEKRKFTLLSRSKYTYDKTGNWIYETTFDNREPPLITEREIEYY